MENEVWKDIKGYEGLYQVSNLGRVKHLEHKIKTKIKHNKYVTKKEHFMKLSITKKGYLDVKLTKDGKSKHFSVHRLVAKAFILNLENKPCVNHLDENPLNNNANNLEWATIKENINYGTRNKRASKKLGISINQYDLDGNFIKTWDSMHEAYRKGNFNPICICRCCKGIQYSHQGYIWKYVE